MIIDLAEKGLFEVENSNDLKAVLEQIEVEFTILVKNIRRDIYYLPNVLKTGFSRFLKQWQELVEDAFRVETVSDYTRAVALFGEEMAGTLYTLQIRMTQFRLGLISIAEPIIQVLLPVVQVAVDVLTGLANSLAQAMRMLFLGTAEADHFAASLTGAAAAGTTLKRSLAGFDQLNRLSDRVGSGLSSIITAKPLSGKWQQVADKLTELVKPLRELDFSAAAESFEKLSDALEPIKRELFAGLEWAWNNLFVPLAQWTVEELLPVFLDMLAESLNALGRVIEELKPMFNWLWEECLKPLLQWKGDQIIAYFQGIIQQLTGVSDWIGENQGPVDQLIQSGKDFVSNLGHSINAMMDWGTAGDGMSDAIENMVATMLLTAAPIGDFSVAVEGIGGLLRSLADVFGLVDQASGNTWTNLSSVWGSLWSYLKQKAMDPAYQGVKDTCNGMIGLANGMLKSAAGGVNTLADSLNKMGFTVPNWIPGIGGKSFYFHMEKLTPPNIPYLAKGAVLPANKPFMAVLGDQHHGTNVEAPLTTIQQAVAEVMDHELGGIMAGFQAVTDRQERILEAVLGIDLSDSALAGAQDRYRNKMAVVTGGY